VKHHARPAPCPTCGGPRIWNGHHRGRHRALCRACAGRGPRRAREVTPAEIMAELPLEGLRARQLAGLLSVLEYALVPVLHRMVDEGVLARDGDTYWPASRAARAPRCSLSEQVGGLRSLTWTARVYRV
jgi:hypothetical protein